MSINQKLATLLDLSGVYYEKVPHNRAVTSELTAVAEQAPSHCQLKAVVLEADDMPIMAVLPADRRINLNKLQRLAGAKKLRLEAERDFAPLFNDSDIGAMPPFGELYGVQTYADNSLKDDEYVFFNGGTHKESVRMRLDDYLSLAEPVMGNFADINYDGRKS